MQNIQINNNLKDYIENNVFPNYKKNDLGHNLDHIKYVIERSLKFASTVEDINYDMVYVIAAYHDIGHYIDAKNHEKVSADMLFKDKNLRKFFIEEEIRIMSEAVYDHRASLKGEPRSIYGKIVSSADRNTLVEVTLKRTYYHRIVHTPESSLEDIIEESRKHILEKFGRDGYATTQMFFNDPDYFKFLKEISLLAEDKEKFKNRYCEVNHIFSRECRLCDEQEKISYAKCLIRKK